MNGKLRRPGPVDTDAIERAVVVILRAIGEDPQRPGLKDTPRRVAAAWKDFIEFEPGNAETVFDHDGSGIILIRDIKAWSICEHHLMPFCLRVAIGYLPDRRIIGASKLPRIVLKAAHRLQLQERLCLDALSDLRRITRSPDVAILASGTHTCMAARGVRCQGEMTTFHGWGRFSNDRGLRSEFLTLAHHPTIR